MRCFFISLLKNPWGIIAFVFLVPLIACMPMDNSLRYYEADLRDVENQMLEGHTFEVQFDKKLSDAVKRMVLTLKPEYRRSRLRKHRLGFLEISDINRNLVTKMHNYISEKTLTFSFLQPVIAEHFNIVERFLLKDVLREIRFESSAYAEAIDQHLARKLGKMYGVDVIETGVVSESYDFIDINLRMIETRRGRIIAVGSVKIEKTELIRRWLNELGSIPSDRLPRYYDYYDYYDYE